MSAYGSSRRLPRGPQVFWSVGTHSAYAAVSGPFQMPIRPPRCRIHEELAQMTPNDQPPAVLKKILE